MNQASAVRPLVLGSASPRRKELLERAGIPFEVAPADVDERVLPGEAARPYAERVAHAKAQAAAALRRESWVLAADTVVIVDGDILGKPADAADAAAMLRRLGGRAHTVLTAVCLVGPAPSGVSAAAPAREEHRFAVETEVVFRPLAPTDVDAYVQSGEWRGKAGGYAVQGIASALVSAVRGSYTNVVGLPLAEVVAELERAGAPGADLARGVPA